MQKSRGNISEETKLKLGDLIDALSNPSMIRPCDLYDLNLSTVLSMNGLILTYLIILIQFNLPAGEISCSSNMDTMYHNVTMNS